MAARFWPGVDRIEHVDQLKLIGNIVELKYRDSALANNQTANFASILKVVAEPSFHLHLHSKCFGPLFVIGSHVTRN